MFCFRSSQGQGADDDDDESTKASTSDSNEDDDMMNSWGVKAVEAASAGALVFGPGFDLSDNSALASLNPVSILYFSIKASRLN